MTSSNRMIFTQVVLSTFVLVRNRKIVLLPPVQVLILLGITKCTLGLGASNLMMAKNYEINVFREGVLNRLLTAFNFSNLWGWIFGKIWFTDPKFINEGSPTYKVPTYAILRLFTCKWGFFALIESFDQSHLLEFFVLPFFQVPKSAWWGCPLYRI